MEVDQYKATHPIEVSVNHPSEVQEIFDDLSCSTDTPSGGWEVVMAARCLQLSSKNLAVKYVVKY